MWGDVSQHRQSERLASSPDFADVQGLLAGQARRLGEGLTIEARAPDGVVEAVSAKVNGAPLLAVQWHPEWRPEQNPQSQIFFQLFGRALRGAPLIVAQEPAQ